MYSAALLERGGFALAGEVVGSLEENSGGQAEKEHKGSGGGQGGFVHRKEQRGFYVVFFSTAAETLLSIDAQHTCCHQLRAIRDFTFCTLVSPEGRWVCCLWMPSYFQTFVCICREASGNIFSSS